MTSRSTTDALRPSDDREEGSLGTIQRERAATGRDVEGVIPGSGNVVDAPGPIHSGNRPDPGPPGAGVQAVKQPGSGLGLIVSFVIAAIVLILGFYVAGDARPNRLPLAQRTTPLFWGLAAVAVVVASVGATYAEQTAARAARAVGRPRIEDALATAWIMPVLATVGAILLVATYHNTTMMVVGPLIAFFGNAGALLARDLLDDVADATHRTATIIHALVIHAIAFLTMGVIYVNKLPIPIAAPIVGVIGGLLTLETLERGTADRPMRLVYAVLSGWSLAFVTMALNWWQTHGWTGGAVLLVCFYLASGVLLARTQRSILRARDLVEFGLVSLVAFVVLAATA